jgi:hypothetical protein
VIRRPSPQRLAFLVAAAGLTLVLALPAGAPARPLVKAFGPGCWKGTGHGSIAGTHSPAKGLTFTIDKSAVTFMLGVDSKRHALGDLDVVGHGSGDVNANGVTATVEIRVTSDISLFGTASKVVADGDLKYTGAVVIGGASSPLNFTAPVDHLPLVIKTATATRVSGTVGNATWTAIRVRKSWRNCA